MTVERDELGFYAPAALYHQGRLGLPVGHATGPEIGTALPDIALPDARGNLVRLHDDRAGAKAAVVFYRSAVWCRHAGCAMRIEVRRGARQTVRDLL